MPELCLPTGLRHQANSSSVHTSTCLRWDVSDFVPPPPTSGSKQARGGPGPGSKKAVPTAGFTTMPQAPNNHPQAPTTYADPPCPVPPEEPSTVSLPQRTFSDSSWDNAFPENTACFTTSQSCSGHSTCLEDSLILIFSTEILPLIHT